MSQIEDTSVKIEEIQLEQQDTIEQMARLEQQIFPDPWSIHEIRSTLKLSHTFCAAAREGVTFLGYFICYYVLDECEIARIAVTEDARRRGIGKKLLDGMEEMCREKEIRKIMLDVRRSNRIAVIFYEKNGFETDGERKFYYGGSNPEDALLMSKTLGDGGNG